MAARSSNEGSRDRAPRGVGDRPRRGESSSRRDGVLLRERRRSMISGDGLRDGPSSRSSRLRLRDRLKLRRSCRYFADTPVPRAIIEAAIEAAGSAPNGANHQPWHFAAISTPETKRAIRDAAEAEEREFYAGKAGPQWLEAQASRGIEPDIGGYRIDKSSCMPHRAA